MNNKITLKIAKEARWAAGGPGRQIIFDSEQAGFGLRVYPSGRKSWVYQYSSGCRRRLLTLGPVVDISLPEARRRASQAKRSLIDGDDPLELRDQRRKAVSVSELCDRYLEDHAPLKKSRAADQRRIEKVIRPSIGRLRIEEVDRSKIEQLYRRIGSMRGPYEANRTLALLSTMFSLAVEWGDFPADLVNPARIPKGQRYREQRRDRPLRTEEVEGLLRAIDEEGDPSLRAILRLLLVTGLRKSELLERRWDDLDKGRGTLRISDTKAGKPRHVPLSTVALGILAEIPQRIGNPFIFVSPNKAGDHRKEIFRPWRRIRERAGCADLRIHDLRHSVATWLAEANMPAQDIQNALGHQSLQTTMRYVHAADRGARTGLENLGAVVLGNRAKQRA